MTIEYPTFCQSETEKQAFRIAVDGGWCEWVRNHSDIVAILAGYRFSIKRAEFVKDFIQTLCFLEPHRPFTLLDFQWRDIIAPIFGWIGPDGKRRFRQAMIFLPKGHGKSLLASAIGLYMLIGDGRSYANCYNAAYDRTQAETIFREAARFVANNPTLQQLLKPIPSTKRILVKGKSGVPMGVFRSLSKDSYNSQGLTHTHCLILDELHVFKDREAYGSLRYATSKVEVNQDHDTPLLFSITTAGAEQVGIGFDEYAYAKKFLNRELPDTPLDYYACIYEVPEDADVFDPEVVKAANPGWGLTMNPNIELAELAKAKASPSEEIIWRRYRCNQWVGTAEVPWINIRTWRKALPLHPREELKGRECFGGLDLSSTNDMTAFVLAFPEIDKSYHLLPFCFVPEKTAEARQRRSRLTPYQAWINQGVLIPTPGDAVDYNFVRQFINTLSEEFSIRQVAIDRLFQGQQMMQNLVDDGFDVVPFGQGHISMAYPMKEFERLAIEGKLRHGNHPVMSWHLQNVRIKVDEAGNAKPDKKRAPDKIDSIVAAVMAIGIASAVNQGVDNDPGIYF